MIHIQVMQDASEIVHYNNMKLPLYIRQSHLSDYPTMCALCHWHEDVECIFILDGEMKYEINGTHLLLKTGDCLIINSRQMHYGYDHTKKECHFICILFHPGLFSANVFLYNQYFQPVLDCPSLEYHHVPSDTPQAPVYGRYMQKIVNLENQKAPGFELQILSVISLFWQQFYQDILPRLSGPEIYRDPMVALQKKMVSYICKQYRGAITLHDIAAAGNISRSQCCRIFQKYLKQSPMDFLNSYRLETARYLLEHTDYSITEIALSCGFNHISYFSETFKRKYGCTPRNYRAKHRIR